MGMKARKPRKKFMLQARPVFPAQWPRDEKAPTPIAKQIRELIRDHFPFSDRLSERTCTELRKIANEVARLERRQTFGWVTVIPNDKGKGASGWTPGDEPVHVIPHSRMDQIEGDFETSFGVFAFDFEEVEVK